MKTPDEVKRKRLAEALRTNLRRRKAQARGDEAAAVAAPADKPE